jgi:hypothetical protein
VAGTGGGKGASKGGKGGSAGPNAALNDDEDLMNRRRVLWGKWKRTKMPDRVIDYVNSPSAPRRIP